MSTPVRRADAVAGGVAASFGAGVFLGPAPAASLAGGWLPLAALLGVLAGGLAVLSTWDHPLASVPSSLWRLGFALSTLARLAAAVAIAGTVAVYLAPFAAMAVVVVATALAVTGVPAVVVRVAAVVVVVVLVLVVIACFAIAPVAPAVAAPGGGSVAGFLGAAGLLAVCLFGPGTDWRADGHDGSAGAGSPAVWRSGRFVVLGAVGVLVLAVVAAAVRQLGAARLAVSPAPLRAALDAADAGAMQTLLMVAVVVGSGFALVAVLRGVPAGGVPRVRVVVAGGVVTIVGVLLIPAGMALAGAAVLLLGDSVFRVVAVRGRR